MFYFFFFEKENFNFLKNFGILIFTLLPFAKYIIKYVTPPTRDKIPRTANTTLIFFAAFAEVLLSDSISVVGKLTPKTPIFIYYPDDTDPE